MKTKVTISNLYFNGSLARFFFTSQAYRTLENLVYWATDSKDALDKLDAQTYDEELDAVNEMFHEETIEELAKRFGIELDETC